MESGSTGSSTPIDPARKYGKPDPLNRNNFLCNFCSKITKGGAYRMKQHLVGGFKNVTKCPQCPEHIREEVKNFMLKKEEVKATNLMSSQDFSYDANDQDEEDELEMLDSSGPNSSKRSGKLLPKKPRTKGPMDMFVAPKANPHKEGSVQVAVDKQLREKTCRVSRAAGALDPSYLTRSSKNLSSTSKGKGVATSSATFTPSSTLRVPVYDDDEIEEDIGRLAYERLAPRASATRTFSASERLAPFTTKISAETETSLSEKPNWLVDQLIIPGNCNVKIMPLLEIAGDLGMKW
ncbi:hypothetical protein V6N12_029696 [Hibiscus sabdariffa]|uniref:BED-type domain-containing protein n=1 Tax=Hibiscus sabdariffa TaxID=183260 RepID=A0ABR2CWV6_9ROSI